MPRAKLLALATALAAGGAAVTLSLAFAQQTTPPRYGELVRGRYLVAVGDCAACHTAEKDKPFAGGVPVPTPFGTIYSTNITPDKETGIGKWTDDQFWKAMHEGVTPDGTHLYPAFPYPWFTKLTRDDVLAIRAYLSTLKPVKQAAKPPQLPFPLDWRGSVAAWNRIFFEPGTYAPNPSKSAQWNRGAYLVEGAGHCGACHSPKNVLGAVKTSKGFEGGKGEGWHAPDLTADARLGLGAWSVDEVVEYLKTGANRRARAVGPMAEVVHDSTSHMSDADLRAMAVYLKDYPRSKAGDSERNAKAPPQDVVNHGRLVYLDQCAGCHMENGTGVPGVFPDLRKNTALRASDPLSLARLVLEGAPSAKTPTRREGFAMPSFGAKLSDDDIAAVLTYVRANFGDHSPPVSASKIASVRKQTVKSASNG